MTKMDKKEINDMVLITNYLIVSMYEEMQNENFKHYQNIRVYNFANPLWVIFKGFLIGLSIGLFVLLIVFS